MASDKYLDLQKKIENIVTHFSSDVEVDRINTEYIPKFLFFLTFCASKG